MVLKTKILFLEIPVENHDIIIIFFILLYVYKEELDSV